ncbi:MAG: M3 family metallopeptidase [Gammaproteobacteria bacterium]|nr:M3 family metallopeptidase [Gammaproteobacteria bacterium]
MNNPLLNNSVLPQFEQIKPAIIKSAIEEILLENRKQISSLEKLEECNWENFVQPLELLDDRLNKAWSPVRHLNSVKSSDELREVYNECLPLMSEYSTEIGQNKKLFDGYQQISNSDNYNDLNDAQQKTLKDSLLYFKLGGVDLSGEDKKKYQSIQKKLSELQTNYENNLLDSTQSWELILEDDCRLQGLPDYAVAMLKQYAEQKSLTGYRITLDMPCYIAVITYAADRNLRKEIYQAFSTRASNQGYTDKKWDNAANMVEILRNRKEKANLLGFSHYSELSLQTKMATSYDEVVKFLNELAEKSLPVAHKDIEQLKEFAKSEGFTEELMAWDNAYYSEKLKQQKYKISDEDLKPYFSEDLVVSGLFKIVEKLYQIKISEVINEIQTWHDDVRFFQIQNADGEISGKFYLDLYARDGKRGGAWMDECINRYKINEKIQQPVAYLTCNLTPPIGDEPALFTHDEVITLFHEFGHGLHHMLTTVDVPEVSGINGVEWDAVELPSQFMENFCWQKEALDLFAKHYKTGESLPDELYQKMIKAKNFQSSLQMLRQIEFSLFDMQLHQRNDVETEQDIQQILDAVRKKVAVIIPPSFNKFQNSFAHIFAGGYAAGYYSYKWAEVLSADAFSAFEKEGIFNIKTGKRFLQCILSQGGSRPARESFECFMGREPEINALLRHNGIDV